MLRGGRPSASLRPRRPLPEPPRSAERRAPLRRRGRGAAGLEPRGERAAGRARAAAAASRQASCSSPKFSLQRLCSFSAVPAPPPRSAPRCRAGAAARRALQSPRGNFWTRWGGPLGEGEERRPGKRVWGANQGAAAGGGAGPGRGHPGEAGLPGSRRADPSRPEAGRWALRAWPGRGVASRGRLDTGCTSPRLGKRRTRGRDAVPELDGGGEGDGGWARRTRAPEGARNAWRRKGGAALGWGGEGNLLMERKVLK